MRILFALLAVDLRAQRSDQRHIVPYAVAGQPSTQIVVLYKGQFARHLHGSRRRQGTGRDPRCGDIPVDRCHAPRRARLGGAKFADGDKLAAPILPVSLTIGGKDARILYAGAAPGLVAGLMQINAIVPQDLTPGNAWPVVVRIGNDASRGAVTMSVR
jgi:hypothetical protein